MKYGDLLLVFLGVISILSTVYALGVNQSIWYIPVIILGSFLVMYYLLKIAK